jgi:hypothetical protein
MAGSLEGGCSSTTPVSRWIRRSSGPPGAVQSKFGRDHAQAFEFSEGARVADGIAAHFDGQVIAAELALVTDARPNPPDRRLVEEQSLGEGLKHVDQIIVTPDVRQLVSQHRL